MQNTSLFRNLTDLERQHIDPIIHGGEADQVEHVISFTNNGEEVVERVIGNDRKSCHIGDDTITALRTGESVIVRHNHPSLDGMKTGRSLSLGDLSLLKDHPSLIEISAHCIDGTMYRARVKDEHRNRFVGAIDLIPEAESIAIQSLNPPPAETISDEDMQDLINGETIEVHATSDLENVAPSLFSMHVVNLALSNLDIIDYEVFPGKTMSHYLGSFDAKIKNAVQDTMKVFSGA